MVAHNFSFFYYFLVKKLSLMTNIEPESMPTYFFPEQTTSTKLHLLLGVQLSYVSVPCQAHSQ